MTSSKKRGRSPVSGTEPDAAVLALAQEIQHEIVRIAEADADADALLEAVAAIPARERLRVAREVFDRLPAEEQWAAITRVFDDSEIRTALQLEHERRLFEVNRRQRILALTKDGASQRRVDLAAVETGVWLRVGLFVESDAAAVLSGASRYTSCARQLDLYAEDPGRFRVIGDTFNPSAGYFVTRSYDRDSWSRERLEPQSVVRVGALSGDGGFEPIVYRGGRVDFEIGGNPVLGRLHLGFLLVEDIDVFSEGDR